MKIQKASEDYLETMLILQESLGYIRSIDIAEHLGVTKPSVSYATKRLRENGYITMDKDGLSTLTDDGGDLDVRYQVEVANMTVGVNHLSLNIKNAEEGAISQ